MAAYLGAGQRRGVWIAKPIAIRIGVPGALACGARLIHGAVAVIVHAVAGLGGPRVHSAVGVVAVGGVGQVAAYLGAGQRRAVCIAKPIAIRIGVPGALACGPGLIHGAVAVIVHAVAGLGGPRVHGAFGIVAVGGVGQVAAYLGAGRDPGSAVAISVPIGIRVPGGCIDRVGIIRGAIAVAVHRIAGLRGPRIHGPICRIAVIVAGEPVPVAVHIPAVQGGDLGCTQRLVVEAQLIDLPHQVVGAVCHGAHIKGLRAVPDGMGDGLGAPQVAIQVEGARRAIPGGDHVVPLAGGQGVAVEAGLGSVAADGEAQHAGAIGDQPVAIGGAIGVSLGHDAAVPARTLAEVRDAHPTREGEG